MAISEFLKPGVMARATESFDKFALAVLVTVWLAAALFLVFASATLSEVLHAKNDAALAESSTPPLPNIMRQPATEAFYKEAADKLKKRFQGIEFQGTNSQLSMSAMEAGQFANWLTAMSSIETTTPDYNWKIDKMCVGPDCGGSLMTVSLVAQNVSFALPEMPIQ